VVATVPPQAIVLKVFGKTKGAAVCALVEVPEKMEATGEKSDQAEKGTRGEHLKYLRERMSLGNQK